MSVAPCPQLPPEQQRALSRARRLEWITLAYLALGVVLVYLVMGSSQAMKVAWIEDLLSLIPPAVFLYASHRSRRPASPAHPYGHARVTATAHLVSAVALLAMGVFLVIDSASGLISGEHPPIGTFHVLGQTVWAGWFMIAAMVFTAAGPVVLGRMKLPLSETLHDKVLYADADMNKADWLTALAAIVGVLGIGLGVWWLDAAAALAIAVTIIADGVEQTRGAIRDFTDGEVRTHDGSAVHPVVDDVLRAVRRPRWVAEAGIRVRDLGHMFHAEVFVVPRGEVSAERISQLAVDIRSVDWKLADVVVAPVTELPEGLRTVPRSDDAR